MTINPLAERELEVILTNQLILHLQDPHYRDNTTGPAFLVIDAYVSSGHIRNGSTTSNSFQTSPPQHSRSTMHNLASAGDRDETDLQPACFCELSFLATVL